MVVGSIATSSSRSTRAPAQSRTVRETAARIGPAGYTKRSTASSWPRGRSSRRSCDHRRRHFVEQIIELLLRSPSEIRRKTELGCISEGPRLDAAGWDDGRHLLMPSAKEESMQQYFSSRNIKVIGDIVRDCQNAWEALNIFRLHALDAFLLHVDDTL